MSDSVWPHRWQPTRLPRPWDSPGKNTGVGCQFLLQCMKVKSESEVTQLCLTLSDPMNCSLPGSSVHGIFQARLLWVPGKSRVPLLSPLDLSNFKQFLILSLSFMALAFLKSTDELFCRLSMWIWAMVSWHWSGYVFLPRMPWKWCSVFHGPYQGVHDVNIAHHEGWLPWSLGWLGISQAFLLQNCYLFFWCWKNILGKIFWDYTSPLSPQILFL